MDTDSPIYRVPPAVLLLVTSPVHTPYSPEGEDRQSKGSCNEGKFRYGQVFVRCYVFKMIEMR